MKKLIYLFSIVLFFSSCSFLPEQPEDIVVETQALQDIVYGDWNIQAVSDPAKYGTDAWQDMTNPFPAISFFSNGQYEKMVDGQVVEQRAFAVLDEGNAESIQLGLPDGIRWEVESIRTNTLVIKRETENGTLKQRLRRK